MQSQTAISVSGSVKDAAGIGVMGPVTLRLKSFGVLVREQYTADGHFEFLGLAPGRYTIFASAPQFEETEVPLIASADDEIVLTLRPRTRSVGTPRLTIPVSELHIPKTARRQFETARESMRKNDLLAAIAAYKQAIATFDDYAEAHNNLGNCYIKAGAALLAEESFKRAIALTPAIHPVLNLADLYTNQGRFSEAEDVLVHGIQRSPSEGNGYYGLAILRFRQQRLSEAEQWARKAHGFVPHHSDVHLLLAKILQREKKADEVFTELELYVREAKAGPEKRRVQELLKAAHRQRFAKAGQR